MTSYFSQIQYVPDPITGERINFGIVSIDADGCRFRFVDDWKRAATFGGEDVSFLKEFADEALTKGANWFSVSGVSAVGDVANVLGHWHNKIQFSSLLPSVKSSEALLSELAPRVLHLGAPPDIESALRHRGRGREKAVSSAASSLAAAMRQRYGHAPRGVLQRHVVLKGSIESHELDVALKNGHLYGGAFAVSFETGSPRSQQRDTDAVAFALDDIKNADDTSEISVIVLPPNPPTPTYTRARKIFKSLEAKVLGERNLTAWASDLVQRLPEDVREQHAAA